MKLSDHKEVTKLINTLDKIDKSIEQIESSLVKYESDDSYWGQFSRHSDGGGELVDLRGCYVCGSVMDAIENILHEKRIKVISELESYGVDTQGV